MPSVGEGPPGGGIVAGRNLFMHQRPIPALLHEDPVRVGRLGPNFQRLDVVRTGWARLSCGTLRLSIEHSFSIR